jgi:TBC1 domain family protein 5
MSARQVAEFKARFGADRKVLFNQAMEGGLRTSSLRGLSWRFFLGSVSGPSATWPAQFEKEREEYAALCQTHCIDPSIASDGLDLDVANPLSVDATSPWSAYFESGPLREDIQKDLRRLQPGVEFFARADVQGAMLTILFVWASSNPEIAYRQGMHELLAPLVQVTWEEAEEAAAAAATAASDAAPTAFFSTPDSELESLVRSLLRKDSVEASCWAVFCKLMHSMRPWFESGSRLVTTGAANEMQTSPLLLTCAHIHGSLLASTDPALHTRLTRLEIEPQLYLLRWLRLLFGREFHPEDVKVIWDAIFAYGYEKGSTSLTLCSYFCVAMLLYVRETLMVADFTGCVKRLHKHAEITVGLVSRRG